jgi:hypothetical protein
MKQFFLFFFGLSTYFASAQYHPDRHNTSYDKGWLSCESADSPNQVRGEGHWIMYDLGQLYNMGESTIWNSNIADNTNLGIKNMAVDYSVDGVTWITAGEYEIPEAPASNFYTGSDGPDLSGIEARYILITALSNYGGSCVGFSEIRLNTAGVVSDVVDVDELDGNLTVSPNPISTIGNVTVGQVPFGNYKLLITDLSGKRIKSETVIINRDKQDISLDVNQYMAGFYVLTLTDGQKLKSITFEVLNNK